MRNDPHLQQILHDFEEIQETRQDKLQEREIDMFKRTSFYDFNEIFKR